MLIEEIVIGLGLLLVVLIMALFMNPPEALVKWFYYRKSKRESQNKSTRD